MAARKSAVSGSLSVKSYTMSGSKGLLSAMGNATAAGLAEALATSEAGGNDAVEEAELNVEVLVELDCNEADDDDDDDDGDDDAATGSVSHGTTTAVLVVVVVAGVAAGGGACGRGEPTTVSLGTLGSSIKQARTQAP